MNSAIVSSYVQEWEHDKYFVNKRENYNLCSLGTRLKQDRRYFLVFLSIPDMDLEVIYLNRPRLPTTQILHAQQSRPDTV